MACGHGVMGRAVGRRVPDRPGLAYHLPLPHGVERWLYERPSYDSLVLAGVIAVYSAVSWSPGVPQASWRYASFSEIVRLAWVCLGPGWPVPWWC